MSLLQDLKFPDFKLPKINIKKKIKIEELTKDIDKIKRVKKTNKIHDTKRYKDIKEVFLDVTKEHKDRTLILESFDKKGKFENITYSKFKEDVISFGTGLKDLLRLSKEKIVIIGDNTYQWYVSYMTVLCSDNIVVPMDKELSEQEIINLVERCNPKAIIYMSNKKEKILNIKDKVNVDYYIEMYNDNEIKDKQVGMNYIINVGKQMVLAGNNTFIDIKIDKEEFKILLFTSGTTSKPKGVMLCHRNLAENLYGATSYVRIEKEDRLFSVLPLHHTYESTIGFLLPFSKGASIAVCRGLKYIVNDMNITKPTILLSVPALAEKLYFKVNLSIKKRKKEGLINSMIHLTNALKSVNLDIKRKVFKDIHDGVGGNLRIIVSAAAPIDKKIGEWYQNIGINFLQGYGLTETAPIAALTPDYNSKVGSVGLPVLPADIKIDSKDEEKGEILIKSSTLMLGYYKDEKLTNEVIKDGYFYSGDIGYKDEEGFIYLTGRSKNVIITSNGKNVYPEELELNLSKIPYIKDVIVYGLNCKNDIKIAAKVTLEQDYIKENCKKNITKEELKEIIFEEIKKINKNLPIHKVIKDLKIIDGDFVKTTTMKIQRHKN